MVSWQDFGVYAAGRPHTVVGTVKVLGQLWSPQLGNQRDLVVYLPPSYAQGQRSYPVLYMHDGQNLFDQTMSYVGEWQVDETMEALSSEGIEAIIVGIPNGGEERMREYAPFPSPRIGPVKGDQYLEFIVDTVKPLVDSDFRTLPERQHTGLLGASMGGLISLYGFFRYGATFGLAGVMSPSLWFSSGAALPYVAQSSHVTGKLYLDVGTNESSPRFSADVRRLQKMLLQKGYRKGKELLYIEDPEGRHHESSWGRRLPGALRFLLNDVGSDRVTG